MHDNAPQSPGGENVLRVLQVSYWLCSSGGGGIQTFLATLTQALNGSPTRCQYAALMPGDAPDYLSATEKSAVHTGLTGESKLANSRRLWKWLNTHLQAVDVVHIHGVLSANFVIAALACKHTGTPYVVSTHGSLASSFLQSRGLKAAIYLSTLGKPLLRGAACILATSDTEAQAISEFDAKLNAQVIPPGIAIDESEPVTTKSASQDCDLRVAFVGRLAPIKALPVLFAAINELREQNINVRLDVIGDGPAEYQQVLTQILEDLGLQQVVTLHGYLLGDAKVSVLRRADVFALPSDSESFGFAAVEALALGLPVIASTGVGLAATVEKHDCGSLVPIRDAHALSQAILKYQDSDFRKRQAANAFRCARTEFSLETMGASLMGVYQHAAARQRAA